MATLCDFVSGATQREREELENALLRGESIFWAVKPVPTYFSAGSGFLMFFAALWLSFIAFWTFGALGMPTSVEDLSNIKGEQIPFALFSIPFWLIGICLAVSPLWNKRKLERTLYVLTDRRALIVEPGIFSWTTEPYTLDENLILSRTARKGGQGDLIFELDYNNKPPTKKGFMNLPDVALAEDKINEAVEARRVAAEE